MHWQVTPYVLPLLITSAISVALALYTWRHRSMPGATSFVWLLLAGAWWSLAYALELGSIEKSAKLFWFKVAYPGIVSTPVAWLAFVLQNTGQEKRLSRRNLLLLALVPLVTLIMTWTSGMHRLFYSSARLDTSGSWPILDLDFRGWFWVHMAYSYLLSLLGTLLLLQMLLRSPSLYHRQARTLLIGALAPWLASVLYLFDLSPFPNLDLTPFAFTLTGLAITWGLFRFQLLDIVPVARDAVVASMKDSVLVLDAQGRIVDLNPAAERALAHTASEIVGQSVAYALSDQSDLVELFEGMTDRHTEITLVPKDAPPDEGESHQTYDLRISPLQDQHGRPTNRLVVLRNITERVRAESQRDATLQALRESEEKYRDLVENISEVIFAVDTNGVITYISPAIEPLSGYSPSELTGRSITQFIHPKDLPGLLEVFQKRFSGHLEPYEYRLLTRSGEIRWVFSSSRLIFDQDRVVGLRGVLTDITEFKRVEEERREREQFLALLNDITRAALETPDLTTMLQTLADQIGELFGADGSYITLWDEATQTTIPAAANDKWRASYRSVDIEPGETTMTESVLRAGHPLAVQDVHDTPHLSPRIAELFPDRSLLGLPLIAGDQKLGAALIAFNELHHFSPDEIARGEQVAGQIALAVAKALLLDETQARWREAETLRRAGAAVTEILSLDKVLERILVQLEQVVPYDSASVQLLRDDHLEIVGGRGFSEQEAVIGLKFPVPSDNPNTAVVKGRKPVLLPDTQTAYPPFCQPPHDHIHSWMGAPLIVHDRVIGILAVDSVELDHFDQEHIRLITPFASQVAVAIENARLFEETERLKGFNEAIVQGVAEAILIADADGMFSFANPAAEALLGYTCEELMGLDWNAIVPEDETDKVRQEATKWLQGIESRYETALLIKAGQVIPIITSVRPMFDGDKFVGVLAAWTDITERVRMEEAIQQELIERVHAEQALQANLVRTEALYHVARSLIAYKSLPELLQTVTDSVAEALPADRVTLITLDLKQQQVTHFVRGGPGYSHVASVSFDELMDGLSGWVLRQSPPQPALSTKGVPDPRESPGVQRRRVETNCGAIIVVPLRHQDETLGTITAINLSDEQDFVQQDVELMMTMAHQAAIAINNAQLVEMLRQYTAELEAYNQELDAYAHTVAHDLTNPLAVMIGYAETLEMDSAALDPDVQLGLRGIAKGGRKMNNIIDELLLLASVRKMEEVALESLDMAGIVTEAQRRLSHMIEEYQAEIIVPDAWTAALGYGPWVEEVWANYLSNALKYGGRPPRVELGAMAQADGTVRFWVRDNGPGLTPEEQRRLFRSFERLDQVRAKGHGLGLSIVRRIVEKLGGEVGVESQVEQGCTFWFTLQAR